MERKQYHETGKKMNYSDIDTRFEPYFDTGERVEVTWKEGFEDWSGYGAKTNGRKARFYIGISTGWKPVFLQVNSTRSLGGVALFSVGVESIRGLGKYRRN